MFWIRDILLVRIQILGSVPLTNGSGSEWGFGSGSCSFRQRPSGSQQENCFFFIKFLCFFLFEGTFTSFFKDMKSYRSRIRIRTNKFLFRMRIRNTDFHLPNTTLSPGCLRYQSFCWVVYLKDLSGTAFGSDKNDIVGIGSQQSRRCCGVVFTVLYVLYQGAAWLS